jgi:outer membrane receptor for ferrienterochelin and colicin
MANSAEMRALVSKPLRKLRGLMTPARALAGMCRARDTSPQAPAEPAEGSLETLNLGVSSPGREEQKLGQTAGAVYVTQKDIQRSGRSGMSDVLPQGPGLQVARIDASSWPVATRGFPGQFADKILILIAGRGIFALEPDPEVALGG